VVVCAHRALFCIAVALPPNGPIAFEMMVPSMQLSSLFARHPSYEARPWGVEERASILHWVQSDQAVQAPPGLLPVLIAHTFYLLACATTFLAVAVIPMAVLCQPPGAVVIKSARQGECYLLRVTP
jgi:hypothetical protein